MSYNYYKHQNLSRTTQAIIRNKTYSETKHSTKNECSNPLSLFLKFGNSDTNPYNAVDTISIYQVFSHENKNVWISTDSLPNGMSQKRIDEINKAVSEDKFVNLYLIPAKTSGGNNQITHKARVLEIQGDKNSMLSPDKKLTPQEWVNGPKKIWIKVGRIRACSSVTTDDFNVISSDRKLSESISKSQYNFGYIVKIIE